MITDHRASCLNLYTCLISIYRATIYQGENAFLNKILFSILLHSSTSHASYCAWSPPKGPQSARKKLQSVEVTFFFFFFKHGVTQA